MSVSIEKSQDWGGAHWPKQPKRLRYEDISWRCPVTGEIKRGKITDCSWVCDEISAWAVDYLPRWLWWIGRNKVGEIGYNVFGADCREYGIRESEVLP